MEQQFISVPAIVRPVIIPEEEDRTESKPKAFIEANTVECSFTEIKEQHIIPVFVKGNDCLISHAEFIEAAISTAAISTDTTNGSTHETTW